MSRLKLLMISEPGLAGVKRHVLDLLEHIDLERFEVRYLYSLSRAESAYPKEIARLESRGVSCQALPMVRQLAPVDDLRSLLAIWRAVRKFRPDIVHCHSAKAGFLGRLAARLSGHGCRVLYTPNALPCYHSRLYLWLERLAGPWTDAILAVSQSEARDIRSFELVPPERVHVFPMGLDLTRYGAPEKRPERVRVVGACGRISHQKNAELFFRAGIELLRQFPDLELRWIGDEGTDREALVVRKLLQECSVRDRIAITGWTSEPLEEMRKLDLFCMFSRFESFGFVTADALMLGLPVVATPATGTVDLILPGQTGLLVEPRVSAIVAATEKLMADSALRAEMSVRGREHVRANFELHRCLGEIFRFYETECGPAQNQ